MKVLVAEDDQVSRHLLEKVLERYGYDVTAVVNGAEALAQALAQPPDMIVSDIMMPEMDGFQLCHECKQKEQLKDIPFVFHTGTYTSDEDKKFALSLGADAFIRKPTKPDIFVQMLSEAFEKVRSRVSATARVAPLEQSLYLTEYNKRILAKLENKIAQLQLEITKRRQAEKALKKAHDELEIRVRERTAELQGINSELEAFTYSVSHDLRTPLRAIDGFSNMLLEDYLDALDEKGKHCLKRVRAGTQKMGRLIDDLLDLSRIGRQPVNKKTINLETVAAEAFKLLEGECNDRKVNFAIRPCLPVLADPSLMQIVFVNLFSNALKFTRCRKTPGIEVGSETRENQTVFFVKDNGAGFDMKYADKLFSPFQRLHRAEEYEGEGLGLSIVQRIIHRHGGRIWAESELDVGTTFYIAV